MTRLHPRDETQAWLAQLQERFSAVVRTPLDTTTGSLRANVESYPPLACADVRPGARLGAPERLAVYNRQYWFRLFGVLQNELPLTSRLFGLWFFNQYVMRFLRAHPPRQHDIHRVADGFDTFLEREIEGETIELTPRGPVLPRAVVLEAARLDAAFRRVFMAPEQSQLARASRSAGEVQRMRLWPSAAYARIEEHWPLVRLRNSLLGDTGETAVRLPEALQAPQCWALFRNAQGVGHIALEPTQARLFALLEAHPLDEALGRLEAECNASEQARLPDVTQRWIAQGVELGFWRGLREE